MCPHDFSQPILNVSTLIILRCFVVLARSLGHIVILFGHRSARKVFEESHPSIQQGDVQSGCCECWQVQEDRRERLLEQHQPDFDRSFIEPPQRL